MGIKGLLNLLKPITTRQHLSVFSGSIIAVDASTWIHHAKTSCIIELSIGCPTQVFLSTLHSRIQRVLQAGIRPIFVFDGAPLPNKHSTAAKRTETSESAALKGFEYLSRASVSINASTSSTNTTSTQPSTNSTQSLIDLALIQFKRIGNRSSFQTLAFQSLLSSLSIPWITAPFEADTQIGYLYQKGLINGVLGEDSDYFLSGCGLSLLKLDSNNLVDVIDLRPNVVQSVVDAYEQAKRKHDIFMNEARLVSFLSDPLVSFHFNQSISTLHPYIEISNSNGNHTLSYPQQNGSTDHTQAVFKLFSQSELTTSNVLLQRYLNDDLYHQFEYDLYNSFGLNEAENQQHGLDPNQINDPLQQIVQVIPYTIKPDNSFTHQLLKESLSSYPQLHLKKLTSHHHDFIARHHNPSFSRRKPLKTDPLYSNDTAIPANSIIVKPKKSTTTPFDLFDERSFQLDPTTNHAKACPVPKLNSKYTLHTLDDSSEHSDIVDNPKSASSKSSLNAFDFMQNKQKQLSSEAKAKLYEKQLKMEENAELRSELATSKAKRNAKKTSKGNFLHSCSKSTSSRNSSLTNRDIADLKSNISALSSDSLFSSESCSQDSSGSESDLIDSDRFSSITNSTSSSGSDSLFSNSDNELLESSILNKFSMRKNRKLSSLPRSNKGKFTTSTKISPADSIEYFDDEGHDISITPTKRSRIQIDSDDEVNDLNFASSSFLSASAVKKQRTALESLLTKPNSIHNSTQSTIDPFVTQQDLFDFSSQELIIPLLSPPNKSSSSSKSTTSTSKRRPLRPPTKENIVLDSDGDDFSLFQSQSTHHSHISSTSFTRTKSSTAAKSHKVPTYLSSYLPDIATSKFTQLLESTFSPLHPKEQSYIVTNKLLSHFLVSIQDEQYFDPNYTPLSLVQLITASTDASNNEIPISNALTESLAFNRLNSMLAPHQHSLRKYIATTPFFFLGSKLQIPSFHHESDPQLQTALFTADNKRQYHKEAADWKYLMQLFSLDHFQFVEVCVLAGCDYLPSMPGIGYKNALTLYCAHGSAHKVIDVWYESILRQLKAPSHTSSIRTETHRAIIEDEFNIIESDVEYSDDNNQNDEEEEPKNKKSLAKQRKKTKTKYSTFNSIDECHQYFTDYHNAFDETMLSYLYQYVIDPLRERFTHVTDLLNLNDFFSATGFSSTPVSNKISSLEFKQQLRFQHSDISNDNLHKLPPQLQDRSQASLFPMLSYFLSQTCSTDDLYGIWSSLQSVQKAITNPRSSHQQQLHHNFSNHLASQLLHHVDREYVNFVPRSPQFILHNNISTVFPVTLNFATITPTIDSLSKSSSPNREHLHNHSFFNPNLPIDDTGITFPPPIVSQLHFPSIHTSPDTPSSTGSESKSPPKYSTDIFLRHLQQQYDIFAHSLSPSPLATNTPEDLRILRSRLFKHINNGVPSSSLSYEDQTELEQLFQLNSSFLNHQRSFLHHLSLQQRSHLFPKSLIYLSVQLNASVPIEQDSRDTTSPSRLKSTHLLTPRKNINQSLTCSRLQQVINKYVDFGLCIGPSLPHSLARGILMGSIDPYWLVYTNPRLHPHNQHDYQHQSKYKIFQYSWSNVLTAMQHKFNSRHLSLQHNLAQRHPGINFKDTFVIDNAAVDLHPLDVIHNPITTANLDHLTHQAQAQTTRYSVASRLHYQLLHLFSQSTIPLPFSLKSPIKIDIDRFNNLQSDSVSSMRLHQFLSQNLGFSYDLLNMIKQTMKELPTMSNQPEQPSSHIPCDILSIHRAHSELSWASFPCEYSHHTQLLQHTSDTIILPSETPASHLTEQFILLPEQDQLLHIALVTSPSDLTNCITDTLTRLEQLSLFEEELHFTSNFGTQGDDLLDVTEERAHLAALVSACQDRLNVLNTTNKVFSLVDFQSPSAQSIEPTMSSLPFSIHQVVQLTNVISKDTLAFVAFNCIVASLTNHLNSEGTHMMPLLSLFQAFGARLDQHPLVAALLSFFRDPISITKTLPPRMVLKTTSSSHIPQPQPLPDQIMLSVFGLYATTQSLRRPLSTTLLLSLLPSFADEAILNAQQFLIAKSLAENKASDLINKRRTQSTLKNISFNAHKSLSTYSLDYSSLLYIPLFQEYQKFVSDHNIVDSLCLPLSSLLIHSEQPFELTDYNSIFSQTIDHVIAGNGDSTAFCNKFISHSIQPPFQQQCATSSSSHPISLSISPSILSLLLSDHLSQALKQYRINTNQHAIQLIFPIVPLYTFTKANFSAANQVATQALFSLSGCVSSACKPAQANSIKLFYSHLLSGSAKHFSCPTPSYPLWSSLHPADFPLSPLTPSALDVDELLSLYSHHSHQQRPAQQSDFQFDHDAAASCDDNQLDSNPSSTFQTNESYPSIQNETLIDDISSFIAESLAIQHQETPHTYNNTFSGPVHNSSLSTSKDNSVAQQNHQPHFQEQSTPSQISHSAKVTLPFIDNTMPLASNEPRSGLDFDDLADLIDDIADLKEMQSAERLRHMNEMQYAESIRNRRHEQQKLVRLEMHQDKKKGTSLHKTQNLDLDLHSSPQKKRSPSTPSVFQGSNKLNLIDDFSDHSQTPLKNIHHHGVALQGQSNFDFDNFDDFIPAKLSNTKLVKTEDDSTSLFDQFDENNDFDFSSPSKKHPTSTFKTKTSSTTSPFARSSLDPSKSTSAVTLKDANPFRTSLSTTSGQTLLNAIATPKNSFLTPPSTPFSPNPRSAPTNKAFTSTPYGILSRAAHKPAHQPGSSSIDFEHGIQVRRESVLQSLAEERSKETATDKQRFYYEKQRRKGKLFFGAEKKDFKKS